MSRNKNTDKYPGTPLKIKLSSGVRIPGDRGAVDKV